jgi:6-phosphogluconate dehydrogenase
MAMIGLGKMGGNMVRRLCRGGIEVVGFDRDTAVVGQIQGEVGMEPAESMADAVSKLSSPKIVWLMLPCGVPTEQAIDELIPMLDKGDIVIDGGNSNYHETQKHGQQFAEYGIEFIDAGTSGGIWGVDNGYCMMVGGNDNAVSQLQPALEVLAPAADRGWAHVGPIGAGHFTKMVHNGIEYGMMQAFAEGLNLMRGKAEFDLDLAQITELWRHSSVVRSWLLDLTADALSHDQDLADLEPIVPDSGEGRWTAVEAIDQGVYTPVMTAALHARFATQDSEGYGNKLLSMMRNAFGGHDMAKKSKVA